MESNMHYSHGGYFGDVNEADFQPGRRGRHASATGPEADAAGLHASALVRKMIELLEQESSAVQQRRHGQSPDAVTVDPQSIAGDPGENPAVPGGKRHVDGNTWLQLLETGKRLLRHLESGMKNPFEFLP